MDSWEFHKSVRVTEASMATQQMARELLASLHGLRIDDVNESLQNGSYGALFKLPLAAGLDILDSSTGWITKRPQVYRLNRALGFSTLESLKHTATDEGLATAIIVLAKEDPSTVESA